MHPYDSHIKATTRSQELRREADAERPVRLARRDRKRHTDQTPAPKHRGVVRPAIA